MKRKWQNGRENSRQRFKGNAVLKLICRLMGSDLLPWEWENQHLHLRLLSEQEKLRVGEQEKLLAMGGEHSPSLLLQAAQEGLKPLPLWI